MLATIAIGLPLLAGVARASWKQTGRAGDTLVVPYSGRQQAFFRQCFDSGHQVGKHLA